MLQDALVQRGYLAEPALDPADGVALYGEATRDATRRLILGQGGMDDGDPGRWVALVNMPTPTMEVVYAQDERIRYPSNGWWDTGGSAPYLTLASGAWFVDVGVSKDITAKNLAVGATVTITNDSGDTLRGTVESVGKNRSKMDWAVRVRLSGAPGLPWYEYLTAMAAFDTTTYAHIPVMAIVEFSKNGERACVTVERYGVRQEVCSSWEAGDAESNLSLARGPL